MTKPDPTQTGLYLVHKNGYKWWEICKFMKYEAEDSDSNSLNIRELPTCEWQEQNNPININTKYGDYITEWKEMPKSFVERFGNDGRNPPDGETCVVKLVSEKYENHGYSIATFKSGEFEFEFPYDDWQRDYNDWQIIEWATIPKD